MKMKQNINNEFLIKSEGKIEIQNDVQRNGGNFEKQNGHLKPLTTKIITMKLCDVCLKFSRKSNSRVSCTYNCIGELCKIGKTYTCDKCANNFFRIQLVKRETKYKCTSFSKKKNRGNKGMSNQERLKVISKRFKTLKYS